jgi:hypothetical protein
VLALGPEHARTPASARGRSAGPEVPPFWLGNRAATLSLLRAHMRENANIIGRPELPWVSPNPRIGCLQRSQLTGLAMQEFRDSVCLRHPRTLGTQPAGP